MGLLLCNGSWNKPRTSLCRDTSTYHTNSGQSAFQTSMLRIRQMIKLQGTHGNTDLARIVIRRICNLCFIQELPSPLNHHLLPFLQSNIVHGEGAITSDAIGSLWTEENTVQPIECMRLLQRLSLKACHLVCEQLTSSSFLGGFKADSIVLIHLAAFSELRAPNSLEVSAPKFICGSGHRR